MIFLNTWRFLIKQMCGSFNESFQVLGQKGLWSSTEYTSSVVLICIDLKNYPMNILQKTTCWITQQQAIGPCIETSQEFLWYAYLQVYTLNNSYVKTCHNEMLSYLCAFHESSYFDMVYLLLNILRFVYIGTCEKLLHFNNPQNV